MAVSGNWMDDESLEDDGVFFNPEDGKYYAKIDYTFKGGKSGFGKSSKFGKRKTKKGQTFIQLAEDEIDEYQAYRDKNQGKAIKGKRGRNAYRGPGSEVNYGADIEPRREGESLAEYNKRSQEARNQAKSDMGAAFKAYKEKSNWWDAERASGERGKARKELVEAQGNAIAAFRARFAVGQGWG